MRWVIFGALLITSDFVFAADDLYRCGNVYTNTPPDGVNCTLVAKNVIVSTQANQEKKSAEWIIWKKFIHKGRPSQGGIYLDPPWQAVGAYLSLGTCLDGIEKSHSVGGQLIGNNPYTYEYMHGTELWACLPKGVKAGAQ